MDGGRPWSLRVACSEVSLGPNPASTFQTGVLCFWCCWPGPESPARFWAWRFEVDGRNARRPSSELAQRRQGPFLKVKHARPQRAKVSSIPSPDAGTIFFREIVNSQSRSRFIGEYGVIRFRHSSSQRTRSEACFKLERSSKLRDCSKGTRETHFSNVHGS